MTQRRRDLSLKDIGKTVGGFLQKSEATKGWGDMITDAFGGTHKLSLGAFDAFAKKHGQEKLGGMVSGSLKRMYASVDKSVQEATKGITDKWPLLKGFEMGPDAGAESMSKLIGGVLSEVKEGVLTSASLAAAQYGPWASAMVEAVGVAVDRYSAKGYIGLPDTVIEPGTWVVIDNGPYHPSKFIERQEAYGDYEMFGDSPDFKFETAPEERDRDASIGFFLGPGEQDRNMVTVFNMKLGRADEVKRKNVMPCTQDQSELFDSDEKLSELREAFFLKSEGVKLDIDAPTDPGAEVFYKGERANIVAAEGGEATIETPDGYQETVSLGELTPGRTDHNVSYNYTDEGQTPVGGPETDAFITDGQDDGLIHRGLWFWAKPSERALHAFPSCKRELACIFMLNRGQIHAYSAYDGWEMLLDKTEIVPCNLRFAETLEGAMVFVKFKALALEGVDMGSKAVGINYPAFTTLTLGITTEKTVRENYWYGEGAKHETAGFWGVNPSKELREENKKEYGYEGDRGKSVLIDDALKKTGVDNTDLDLNIDLTFERGPGAVGGGDGFGGIILIAGILLFGGLAMTGGVTN